MGADAISVIEDLDGGTGRTNIHLLLDILIWYRVIHLIHRDVVVGCNSCDLPGCQFKGTGRQRKKKWSFLFKDKSAAAVLLLERLMIELVQSLANGLIQLCQRQKPSVTQSRQDEITDNAYCTFYHGFILGGTDTAWQDRCSVMLSKVIVGFIQRDLASTMRNDAGFEIVALQNACNTAEMLVGIDVRRRPTFLIH